MTNLTQPELILTTYLVLALQIVIYFVVARHVPARSLQEDGSPLLHREEQVSPRQSLQEEDHLLPRHHSGESCPPLRGEIIQVMIN